MLPPLACTHHITAVRAVSLLLRLFSLPCISEQRCAAPIALTLFVCAHPRGAEVPHKSRSWPRAQVTMLKADGWPRLCSSKAEALCACGGHQKWLEPTNGQLIESMATLAWVWYANRRASFRPLVNNAPRCVGENKCKQWRERFAQVTVGFLSHKK